MACFAACLCSYSLSIRSYIHSSRYASQNGESRNWGKNISNLCITGIPRRNAADFFSFAAGCGDALRIHARSVFPGDVGGVVPRRPEGAGSVIYLPPKTQKVEEWLDSPGGAWVRVVKSGKKWEGVRGEHVQRAFTTRTGPEGTAHAAPGVP